MGRREVRSTPAPEEPFRPRRRNEQGNKNNCAASGPVHRVRSLAFPTAPEADVLSALRPHALPDRQDHLAGVDPDAQRARRGPGNLLLQHQRRSLGVVFHGVEVDALRHCQPEIDEQRGIHTAVFMAAPQD